MIIKKLVKKMVSFIMKMRGYSDYFSYRVFQERYQDIFKNKNTTLKQKVWAQSRGFLSDKIDFYGLTEENYLFFLSDFDYWKLHPINGEYGKWIDDKLTFRYILSPFSENLPEYYFQIGRNKIEPLMDCPKNLVSNLSSIKDLLSIKQKIALKKISGSAGEGFFKLECDDISYSINGKRIDEDGLLFFLNKLVENSTIYLFTEFIDTHDDLKSIWDKSPNTLRLTVINELDNEPKIISALIRFGTMNTGVIDNALSGGVFSKINLDNGYYNDGKIILNSNLIACTIHPNSNKNIVGVIPNWELITEETRRICSYIPQIRYMGIDIIITNDGFKIIEINSHPNIEFIQYDKPVFKNNLCQDFYKFLLIEKQLL